MSWTHTEYPEGRIKDWVDGIERNLQNVTANKDHDSVKDSILEQAKRLADTAVHNTTYRKEWFADVRTEIEELAEFYSVEVPVVYGDGEESKDKMLSLEELGRILTTIELAIGERL